tara:strand:+ start:2476 stop:2868 length:393 start_codon:yes stop_codon:yes gene_type:complete
MVRMKKSLYWHTIAEYLLKNGLTPTECSKVMKQCFTNTNVNGRHIGAYKRRLIDEGKIEKNSTNDVKLTVNEAYSLVKGMITDEDRFIYQCSIGAQRRTLKCFEYKMTMELKEDSDIEEIDVWIGKLKKG